MEIRTSDLDRDALQVAISELWREVGRRRDQHRTGELRPLDSAENCEQLMEDGPIALYPEESADGLVWCAIWKGEGKIAGAQTTDRRLAVVMAYLHGAGNAMAN